MPVDVFPTPYGRPAARVLHQRLAAAKADDPLRPVTVVVPSNYVGVSTRRLLASGTLGPVSGRGTGLAGITLLTVYRLAELLGAPRLAAAGRRPVSTPVLAAAVRRALREEPGAFASVADHPATEDALVRAYRELADVSDGGLDAVAVTSTRAAHVVRIHRLVRRRLEDAWYGEADLMRAATDSVRAGTAVVGDLGVVLVHLPQALRRPSAALVRALADRTAVEVVVGRTGDHDADADVDRTLADLGLTPPAPPPAFAAPVADEVVSVSDAEDEVRVAVRRVVAAVREGTPLERIALLSPAPEPYARLCHEHLAAAGVPYNGAAVRPLAQRLVGRWLLDLLGLDHGGWRRADIMDLVAAAPVRAGDGTMVPAGRWDRISRDAGVVRGRDGWQERLARHARDRRDEAERERAAEDPRVWLVEGRERDATDAGQLGAFVAGLGAALDDAAASTTWGDLVIAARRLVKRYLGGAHQRGGWPESERTAADRIDAALERIAALDAVDDRPSLDALRRTVELELDADLARVGRFGEGVLVGRLADVLGVDLDLVLVLGCAEGLLPSRVREDSLLPDAERLATTELRPRSDRVGVEHRHLLAALASAEHRVLSFPRGDLRRSTERPPSRWLLDTVARRRGDGVRELDRGAPWFREVRSFAGGLREVVFPATAQEHSLRAIGDQVGPGGRLESSPDPALAAGLALVAGRRSDRFTRFDGDLSGVVHLLPLPTRTDRVVAPTALEAWTRCPFAYFVERVLGVGAVEEPEELLTMDPRDSGDLVHGVLERWLRTALDPAPGPNTAWGGPQRAALQDLGVAACEDAVARGIAGHPRLWGRDRARLLLDFRRFCEEDDARRRTHGATPLAVELSFGIDGAPPLPVTLPDGRTVRLRGRIDRVDRRADGALLVTDYKTGSIRRYSDLMKADPVMAGERLQLPVYGLAARAAYGTDTPVMAQYWFTSTRGEWKEVGYPVTAAVEQRFLAVLTTITDGLADGVFAARPAEQDTAPHGWIDCRACDPDGLGSRERRRAWERKRSDPRLAAYRQLVEPEVAP